MSHIEIRIENSRSFFRHIRNIAGGIDHPVMSFESEAELVRWLNEELGAVVEHRPNGSVVGHVPELGESYSEGASIQEMAEKLLALVEGLKQEGA